MVEPIAAMRVQTKLCRLPNKKWRLLELLFDQSEFRLTRDLFALFLQQYRTAFQVFN